MAATARLTRAERTAQTRGELLAAAQRRFFEAGDANGAPPLMPGGDAAWFATSVHSDR